MDEKQTWKLCVTRPVHRAQTQPQLIMMIADYIEGFLRLMRPPEGRSVEVIRSDYRRLRRMHRSDRNLIFDNSRMLPTMQTNLGNTSVGMEYWSHLRHGVALDCCTLHRARKQILMSILNAQENPDYSLSSHDRMLKKFLAATQKEIRDDRLSPVLSVERAVQRRERMALVRSQESEAVMNSLNDRQNQTETKTETKNGTPDALTLRYHLRLIQQRLERMLRRTG